MIRIEALEQQNKTLKGQLQRRTRFLGKARNIKISTNWNDAHHEFKERNHENQIQLKEEKKKAQAGVDINKKL